MLGREQRNWFVSTLIALVLHIAIFLAFISQMNAGISRKPQTEISIVDMPTLMDPSQKAVNAAKTIRPNVATHALSQQEKNHKRLSGKPLQAEPAIVENDAQRPARPAPAMIAALENDSARIARSDTAIPASKSDTTIALTPSTNIGSIGIVTPESQVPLKNAAAQLPQAPAQKTALSKAVKKYAIDANNTPTITKAAMPRNFRRIEVASVGSKKAKSAATSVRVASAPAAAEKPAVAGAPTRLQQSILAIRPKQSISPTAPKRVSSAIAAEKANEAERLENTSTATLPQKTDTAIKPQNTVSASRPKSALSATRPDQAISAVRPDTAISATRPDKPVSATRPDKPLSAIRPDKPLSAIRPDSTISATRPVASGTAIKPETPSSAIRPAKNARLPVTPKPTTASRTGTTAIANKLKTIPSRARRPGKLRIQILTKAPITRVQQKTGPARIIASRAKTATRVLQNRPTTAVKPLKPTNSTQAKPQRFVARKVESRRLALVIRPTQSLRKKRQATLREGRLKYGRLNKYLEEQKGSTCLVALSFISKEGQVRISGIGRAVNPWARYLENLSQQTRLAIPASLARISDHQCQVASFIRRAETYPVFKVQFNLEKNEIKTGDFLKGTLSNIGDNYLNLYLVDDEGTAQRLNSFLTSDENGRHFAIQLNIVGGATSTAQLLLAIVTDQPLESTRDNFPVVVTSLLEDVEQEIAARHIKLDLAINSFIMR